MVQIPSEDITVHRALLEGWASFMWRRFTGVLIWKTQNPWAGLRGQLYDWLLAPTGAYFGVQLACEPVHVQLNLHRHQVRHKMNSIAEGPDLSTHFRLPTSELLYSARMFS